MNLLTIFKRKQPVATEVLQAAPSKDVAVTKPTAMPWIVPAAQTRWLAAGIQHYTPQRVEQIFRQALGGDLTSQWEMFDLMEATWPRLTKNLNELKDAVVSMRFSVQPWTLENEDATPEAERRAKLVSELLWRMDPNPAKDENDFDDTVRDLLDARGKGISILEVDWISGKSSNGAAILPRATRWIHPSYYGYANDQPAELMLRSAADGTNRGGNFIPFPRNKFLIGVCKNKTGHPLGSAMLHVLGFWWAAANFTAEWFLNFAQVFGQPIRWATYDPTMSGADQAKLALMLENMGSAAWGMFPAGTQMELKEAGKSAGDSPQMALLAMADKICDLVILRQTLTSDVGDSGGSRALGEVHERVLSGVQLSCAKWTAKVLGQLVRSICELNFGDTNECPWLQPVIEDEGDGKRVSDQLLVLANAGLEPVDDALPELSERIGFEIQRKALPPAMDFGGGFNRGAGALPPAGNKTEPDVQQLAAAGTPVRKITHPSDAIAARKAKALGEIYRGSMAPFRQIILNSTSKEDAFEKLSAAYADWKPERLNSELEIALQVCAAAGASEAIRS